MGTPQTLAGDLGAELARRLEAARALSGKKTKAFAAELGWSREKIRRFERGDQVPDAIELYLIAIATGQPIEYFYGASSDDGGTDGRGTIPQPLAGVKPGNGGHDEVGS